ncbi:TPR end-of-group domain-containing protein [Aquisphaera insulae]|uniref:TPR end-of-group domain-containing protein n=1 Tax=Aquisphaera insulae TaxID=2712864 RepID=UPI0013EC270D|nr:tetratricopeptide repeat protein [Aquisphaera insulae]
MSRTISDRSRRRLHEAEGYLELDLPQHALQILESRRDWPGLQFEACLIHGEALRRLDRYREAIAPLEIASTLRPDDTRVALALGWCFKRSNRLAQAIDALERVRRHHPDNSLLHYNLACYWSLAGNADRALEELRAALSLEPDLRIQVAGEEDFRRLRGIPAFEELVAGPMHKP